jgi:LuxR family transcriptional regulator, positive regulator of biofilm formation
MRVEQKNVARTSNVIDLQRNSAKINLLSPRNLASELLAHALEKEVNAACEIFPVLNDFMESLKSEPDGRAQNTSSARTILLVDCIENDFDEVMRALSDQQLKPCENLIIAIYNVYPGWGIEEEALRSGVKGFFYKQDSLKLFLKGISAILGREIWVSREILMRSALRGLRKTQSSIQERTGLSEREIEILRLLGSGAPNEEIAQKLFISPNTVKTHLYNIFKKIDVSSRLDAAAWTAKNL